ncbi:hypothetical protein SAMN06296386_102134 [Lachnospiraceae bacterium]|nr:hypothetical protein SAMN06296386_102134 [Lachnospiraceae bacterium]
MIDQISSVGVTTEVSAVYNKNTDTSKKTNSSKTASSLAEESGAVYEGSVDSAVSSGTKTTSKNSIIAQLQADAEKRTEQLRSIVEKLISGQGKSYSLANDDDAMWRFLASGDFEVDEETKRQAQEDISEDGYWGVKQTSDRILDFAKALSGNDPSKADELLDAFKKGFEEATKSWGRELPDISKRTYEAVEQKFNEWKNSASTE